MSAVVFGLMGAVVGNAACKGVPHDDETEDTKQETSVKVKKDRQALTAWETSGGASGEAACFLWDETVREEGWYYTASTAEEACEMAVMVAETLNEGECSRLKPRLCNMNADHRTVSSSAVQTKRGNWKCTVTVETDCNFSVF